jgi:Kef-type K+ transport system membrane component KefB
MELILKVSIALCVGFIFGKLAKKVKLPSVSGYLIGGLFLGPSFFNLISDTDSSALVFISEIALSVIAFSIGSEFLFSDLKKIGKSILVITILEVIGAIGLVFFVMYVIFNQPLAFSLVIASMSAATAPAATLLVIRQYRAKGPLTKSILPVVALDDVFGIIAFGLALSVAKMLISPTDSSLLNMFIHPIIEILGSLVLGFILGLLLRFVSKKAESKDELQIMSLIAIGVALGLAKWLGLSPLLTNIALGTTIVNTLKYSNRIFSSVNDFITPFYVLFFTLAGATLHLEVLGTIGLIGIAYILARGIGKYLGATLGAKSVKADPKVIRYLGLALLPQGGISIGLSVIVRQELPLYATAITTIIMFSVLIYETTGPIFAKIAIKSAGEMNPEPVSLHFEES